MKPPSALLKDAFLYFQPWVSIPEDRLRLVLSGSQFLLQFCYRLLFVYFNLARALMVDSGASAFGYYLL